MIWQIGKHIFIGLFIQARDQFSCSIVEFSALADFWRGAKDAWAENAVDKALQDRLGLPRAAPEVSGSFILETWMSPQRVH